MFRSAKSGGALIGEVLELGHGQPDLVQRGRETSAVLTRARRCARRSPWPEIAGVVERKTRDVRPPSARKGVRARVSPLLARLASCRFCSARMARDAVGLAQRGVGPDRSPHRGSCPRPARARAELVEDQPGRRSAKGRRWMFLDQIQVDGRAVALERPAGTGHRRSARLGSSGAEAGGVVPGGAGLRRGAVDELLTDQRLWPDQAAGVPAGSP